jgi:magnesium-protoporphyrin O-methyltransferase
MPDGRPGCDPGCGCRGNEFGEATAKRDLRAYRKNGPGTTTRWLIEGLEAGGVEGLTVLDIGAGVGAVHQQLLADGAASAIDVDGSAAFVAAARTEATVRGTIERIRYEVGDFVDLAPEIEDSDLVALDRVICCYPDMVSLVRLSVAHARRRYGLVYPRDTWWIRLGARVVNTVKPALPPADDGLRPPDRRGGRDRARRRLRFAPVPVRDVLAGRGLRANGARLIAPGWSIVRP